MSFTIKCEVPWCGRSFEPTCFENRECSNACVEAMGALKRSSERYNREVESIRRRHLGLPEYVSPPYGVVGPSPYWSPWVYGWDCPRCHAYVPDSFRHMHYDRERGWYPESEARCSTIGCGEIRRLG